MNPAQALLAMSKRTTPIEKSKPEIKLKPEPRLESKPKPKLEPKPKPEPKPEPKPKPKPKPKPEKNEVCDSPDEIKKAPKNKPVKNEDIQMSLEERVKIRNPSYIPIKERPFKCRVNKTVNTAYDCGQCDHKKTGGTRAACVAFNGIK